MSTLSPLFVLHLNCNFKHSFFVFMFADLYNILCFTLLFLSLSICLTLSQRHYFFLLKKKKKKTFSTLFLFPSKLSFFKMLKIKKRQFVWVGIATSHEETVYCWFSNCKYLVNKGTLLLSLFSEDTECHSSNKVYSFLSFIENNIGRNVN